MVYLPGKINQIFEDGQVTHSEYGELEQAVYGEGGVLIWDEILAIERYVDPIETLEKRLILPIFSPLAEDLFNDRGGILFEDSLDEERFDLLLGQSFFDSPSYTLQIYLDRLEENGLDPVTNAATLMALSYSKVKDTLPTVHFLEINKDGSFEVELTKGEASTRWRYDGEFNLQNFSDSLYPFSYEEVFLALEEFRQGEIPEAESDVALEASRAIAESLEAHKLTEPRFQRFIYGKFNERSRKVSPNLFREAPEKLKLEGLPPIFYGLAPEGEALEAIQEGMNSIPQEVHRQLLAHDVTFILDRLSRLARERYNQRPKDKMPIPTFLGKTRWDKQAHSIAINIEIDPHAIAHALVHETGHALLHGLTKGKGSAEGQNHPAMKVLNHHFSVLKGKARGHPLRKFPTIYSSGSFLEWFPEMFAIFYLGQSGSNLRMGVESFHQDLGVGEKRLLEKFKRKDPVGYLLMFKVDQLLREGADPLKALTWDAYQKVTELVEANGGKIDTRVEQEWRETSFDLTVDETYQAIVQTDYSSEQEEIEALAALHDRAPDLYPLKRDLLIAKMRLKVDQDENKADYVSTSMEDLFDEFDPLFRENPYDKELQSLFADLLVYDPNEFMDERRWQVITDDKIQEKNG